MFVLVIVTSPTAAAFNQRQKEMITGARRHGRATEVECHSPDQRHKNSFLVKLGTRQLRAHVGVRARTFIWEPRNLRTQIRPRNAIWGERVRFCLTFWTEIEFNLPSRMRCR